MPQRAIGVLIMTKTKLTLLASTATLSLAGSVSSFAVDAKMPHICTRKLRLVLRVLLLVWATGSLCVLGSTESHAQNAYIANELSDNVTVIDTRTNTVVGSPITVGDSSW